MAQNQDFVVLDADKTSVAQSAIQDVARAVGALGASLKGGKVSSELVKSSLGVAGYRLADLAKLFDLDTLTRQEVEERHVRLRQANMRVRELEKQMGSGVTPESAQMQIRNLSEQLNKWWNLEGFGHINDISFGPYGCTVTFSCHLFGRFSRIRSKTPVSDKSRKQLWHESLKERGFVLVEEPGEDVELVDCEVTRATLCELFRNRLPSAQVDSLETSTNSSGMFILRSVKAYIRNISDMATLPIPAESEQA